MALAIFGLTGAACGGDDGPVAKPGTVNPGGARSATTQASDMTAALLARNGAGLSSSAMSLSTSANSVVTAAPGQPLTAANTAATTSGTATCDDVGCTYTDFNAGSGFVFNGYVRAADAGSDTKRVTWDLSIKGTGLGSSISGLSTFDYKATGDIILSATSINGQASGSWSGGISEGGQNISYKYSSLIKFQSVTLDGSKCPTGGSVYAKWSIEVSGVQGAQNASQAYDGTHTFTGCGA